MASTVVPRQQHDRAVIFVRALEPRGEVHIIADDRVRHALDRTDGASEHLARGEPNTDLYGLEPVLGPSLVRRPSARIISVATSNALSASTDPTTGAPKIAISPSPRYLSSIPPRVKITSTISVKYSLSNITVARGV